MPTMPYGDELWKVWVPPACLSSAWAARPAPARDLGAPWRCRARL